MTVLFSASPNLVQPLWAGMSCAYPCWWERALWLYLKHSMRNQPLHRSRGLSLWSPGSLPPYPSLWQTLQSWEPTPLGQCISNFSSAEFLPWILHTKSIHRNTKVMVINDEEEEMFNLQWVEDTVGKWHFDLQMLLLFLNLFRATAV